MANATAILPNGTLHVSSVPNSYYSYPDYSDFIIAHIILMTVGWLFVLPIGVMLSIARSRLAFPTQLTFLCVNAIGLVFSTVYNARTPDFYENNAHHKLGWVVTWIASAQAIISFVRSYIHSDHNLRMDGAGSGAAQYQRVQDLRSAEQQRYSRDSGQGTEPNSPRTSSLASEQAYEEERLYASGAHLDKELGDAQEKHGLLENNTANRFPATKLSWLAHSRGMRYLELLYGFADRAILVLGFMAVTSGGVTYGGLFKGAYIFSGLAHFVKGGIFFWYGLFTLGRYFGAFADLGWAWNISVRDGVTAEFVESFLIFFYGSTNVFLEHLGSYGKEWSAGDLEHVSISVMFFGGGLCGMLVESRKVRELLNSALKPSFNGQTSLDAWQTPRTYTISTNPLPGIVLLLLGLLMSSHHQASMVSTMLHKQWGTLFIGAALARGVTYITLYLSPPTSFLPSRPPSELVVALCLVSGGLLFMSSNSDMVEAMEAHELNAMFVFTLTMGVATFLMAWTIIVLAVKAWAVRRAAQHSLTAA